MVKSILPFLCTGTILPYFQLPGKFPVSIENWKILKKGFTKDLSQVLTTPTETLSQPWALLTSKAQIIDRIFAGSTFTDFKRSWLSRSQETYCLCQLKSIAFQKKSWRCSRFPRYQLKTYYCVVWEQFFGILSFCNSPSKIDQYCWELLGHSKITSTGKVIRFGLFNCTFALWNNVTKNLIVSNTSAILNITLVDFCFVKETMYPYSWLWWLILVQSY